MSIALTSLIAILLAVLFSFVGGRLRRRNRDSGAESAADRKALETIARIEAERRERNAP